MGKGRCKDERRRFQERKEKRGEEEGRAEGRERMESILDKLHGAPITLRRALACSYCASRSRRTLAEYRARP